MIMGKPTDTPGVSAVLPMIIYVGSGWSRGATLLR